jgi:ABC-type proline/glycine betaine transport system permease subunit
VPVVMLIPLVLVPVLALMLLLVPVSSFGADAAVATKC